LTEIKYTNPDGEDIYIHQHNTSCNPEYGDYAYLDELLVEEGTINFTKSKNIIVRDGRIIRLERKNSFMRAISKKCKKSFGIYKE